MNAKKIKIVTKTKVAWKANASSKMTMGMVGLKPEIVTIKIKLFIQDEPKFAGTRSMTTAIMSLMKKTVSVEMVQNNPVDSPTKANVAKESSVAAMKNGANAKVKFNLKKSYATN